jgi:hypothetical protein
VGPNAVVDANNNPNVTGASATQEYDSSGAPEKTPEPLVINGLLESDDIFAFESGGGGDTDPTANAGNIDAGAPQMVYFVPSAMSFGTSDLTDDLDPAVKV